MLTKWRLGNYKSVVGPAELELAPLTILCGANSSGKSSFIQSMLLVAQSLGSKMTSRELVLNGPLVRLGTFQDIRSSLTDEPEIRVGWDYNETRRASRMHSSTTRYYFAGGNAEWSSCDIAFGQGESNDQLHPRLNSTTVVAGGKTPDGPSVANASFRRSASSPDQRMAALRVSEGLPNAAPASLQFEVGQLDPASRQRVTAEFVGAEVVGAQLRHFLPVTLTVRADLMKERVAAIQDVLYAAETARRPRLGSGRFGRLDATIPSAVLRVVLDACAQGGVTPPPFLTTNPIGGPEIDLERWQAEFRRLPPTTRARIADAIQNRAADIDALLQQDATPQYYTTAVPIPFLSYATEQIEEFFTESFHYLGPLRDEPRALYPLDPMERPGDVGLRGEFTAAVLNLYGDQVVSYPEPPSEDLAPDAWTTSRTSLRRAVARWLQYLEVADQISTEDLGKLGHSLTVSTRADEALHDLGHVGVGVSQVLPIVVMCLLASPDSLLVVEQPELHLHPKVQARLADFFLALSRQGRQCIVETHSEYLISRLRLRSALAAGDSISSSIAVYFVERRDGISRARRVQVNRFGVIEDWPDDFFDQSQEEAGRIVSASALKRSMEREGNG